MRTICILYIGAMLACGVLKVLVDIVVHVGVVITSVNKEMYPVEVTQK